MRPRNRAEYRAPAGQPCPGTPYGRHGDDPHGRFRDTYHQRSGYGYRPPYGRDDAGNAPYRKASSESSNRSGHQGQSAFPIPVRQRLPLLRPKSKRVLCGVCRGLSLHLSIPVTVIRLAFIALTFLFGSGIAAYVFLWVFVPAGDPLAAYWAQRTANQGPLSRGNAAYQPRDDAYRGNGADFGYQNSGSTKRTRTNGAAPSPYQQHVRSGTAANSPSGTASHRQSQETSAQPAMDSSAMFDDDTIANAFGSFEDIGQALRRASKPSLIALSGLALIVLSIALAASPIPADLTIGGLFALCGIGVAWLKMNAAKGQLPYLIVGVALVGVGYIICTDSPAFHSHLPISAMVAGLALLAGVAVALVPLGNKFVHDLGHERALKEREEERADMTAHLHDGVLQTLALIQLHSDEPENVFALARGQERELRRWLYQDRTPPERSVGAGLHEIAARIEDEYRKPIDVVTVGDARPSAQTDALLNASEQAMLNAAQHGGEPISVYCEAGRNKVEVFVRDHGKGFDVNAIPEDRLGIRESIVGRIKRRGGTAEIVSRPQWGTEVRMHMPISGQRDGGDGIMADGDRTGDAHE
ncbi:PspC domain-containing protein [Bifidobacterium sp. ESL0763]|uniref:ATP-binding protein n=1 Tax=Bifidobacterium sp. ESL0763 TaxID=2983227 RepID=UPI0023F76AE9|nr:ATP-binding protein [Bifidobacterium sp. ESL0763]MDF7663498.1 PspC domain-containing protein [Bifidobacterium sp. ESL0763]